MVDITTGAGYQVSWGFLYILSNTGMGKYMGLYIMVKV